MKKLLCVISALLLLIGCGKTEVETTSTSPPETVEIRLVCEKDFALIQRLTTAYQEANPNVKIVLTTPDPNDDFALATKALLSGQQTPTLILTKAEYLTALSEYFSDLSNEDWVKNALPNTLNEVSREGKIIAIPAEIEGIGLVYDTRVFEILSINPENINSIDRLNEIAQYLSEKLPELENGLDSVFEAPDEETIKHLINLVVSQEYTSSAELGQNEPELTHTDTLESLLSLLQQGRAGAKGIIALQSHKTVREAAYFDMLPVPILNGSQDSIMLNVPAYWAVNKNATKSEQNAAKSFLSWVYNSETGNAILSRELEWISPFDNATQIPDASIAKTVRKYATGGKTMPYILNGIDQEIYNQIKARLMD